MFDLSKAFAMVLYERSVLYGMSVETPLLDQVHVRDKQFLFEADKRWDKGLLTKARTDCSGKCSKLSHCVK